MRRTFGFFFCVVGAALPTFVLLRLLLCPPKNTEDAGVAFWIIHALPLAASMLLGSAMFAVAGRLQISTDAIERIELQKARSRAKCTSTLAVDLPKTVRLGSSEE